MSAVDFRAARPVSADGSGAQRDPLRAAEEAVARVRRAQRVWAATPLARRLRVVHRLRVHLGRRGHELAGMTGRADRPGWLARTEALSAEVVPLADACAFLERRAGELLAPRPEGAAGRPAWLRGVELEVRREPLGTVLVVAPSNYPIFLPGVQLLQALVAGNGVLVKPGHRGSAALRWLATALAEAGLPEGVLVVLPEAPEAVRRCVELGVDKVFLTGSADTGRELLTALAPRLTPATLELSGCDALVALDDADPELVAAALAFGLRLNGGATCIAPRRAFVHHALLAAVEDRLAAAVERMVRPAEPGPEPMARAPVSAASWHRARELVAAAVEGGARLVCGDLSRQGSTTPFVVADPPAGAELLRADLFAPVVTLVPVGDVDEAVLRANDCPYALGASVFGGEEQARAAAARLHAGVVTVNDVVVPTADPRLPFGGRGRSGFGLTRGAEGLLEMTAIKAVAVRRGGRHRHLERPRPEDEPLFRAWLRFAHGGSWSRRLGALPALLGALWRRALAGRRAPIPLRHPKLDPTHEETA